MKQNSRNVLIINVMYMWRTPRLVLNALFGQSTIAVIFHLSQGLSAMQFAIINFYVCLSYKSISYLSS